MDTRERLAQLTSLLSFDPILEEGKDTCAAWDYVAQQLVPSNGAIKTPREIFAEECLRVAYEPDVQNNSKMVSILLSRAATRCMGIEWVNRWLDINYYDLFCPKTKSKVLNRMHTGKYF